MNQNYFLKGHISSSLLSLSFFLHIQFAGFSSESLCERIMDAQSSVLVTAGRSSSPAFVQTGDPCANTAAPAFDALYCSIQVSKHDFQGVN